MSNLLDRLRQETRLLHEQTETLFYGESLQNGTLSSSEYEHLLRTHLIYHRALETAIDAHPDFFTDYQPETRRKTSWLITDLAQFSNTPLPISVDLFAGWSAGALLGAAYVGEGSMLGGTVINRLLQKNRALFPVLGQARFYEGYGSAVGKMWKAFGEFLTETGTPVANEVVNGANRAFGLYQKAFKETGLVVNT